MRRPRIDAVALLAAHGFQTAAQLAAESPVSAPVHVFRNYFRRPAMAEGTRYALVREPDNSIAKPSVFGDLHHLARAIHRDRNGAPIQMVESDLLFQGEETPRKGVNVWTLDPFSMDRKDFLGWAYLNGGDRFLLLAAMPGQGGVAAIRAA